MLSIDAKKNRVVVEHVAIMKRHTRPNPQKNIKGGIVEKEAAIQRFQRAWWSVRSCNKHTRIGHTVLPDGTKTRSCRRCNTRWTSKAICNLSKRRKKAMKSRLQEKYRKETVPALMKHFGWKNIMAVPKLSKVTVNIGLGEASQNAKLLDTAAVELGQITGQKPMITRAKKSIANFKIRKGMPIGCAVTLRGDKMYEFLDRLCNVVLPRVRDFRGLPSNAFDGRGNYTLGLKDQLVFPEIDYTRVDKIKGMNITLTTTAKNDEEGRELLKGLGFPLRAPGVAQ